MMRKQRGAAGIYMALLLIPLFGAIFLALEGTRYIQKQNRLADGAEAAALAVTMANHGNTSSYEKDLAEKYIQSYVRDIKNISQLEVTSKEGQTIIPSSEGNIEKNYTQYKVTAKTSHNSWFSNTLIPSFSPTETIANQAVARNYPEIAGDIYLDIVFAADFSGSMRRDRIKRLKKAINTITENLLENAPAKNEDTVKNRVAIVPFSDRTQEKIGTERVCATQLAYRNDYDSGLSSTTYEQVNWYYWAEQSPEYTYECASDESKCTNYSNSHKENQSARRAVWGGVENFNYIHYTNSIKFLFDNKVLKNKLHFRSNAENKRFSDLCKGNFWTVPLTDNKEKFLTDLKEMEPRGRTSAYQSIIRSAQIMKEGIVDKKHNSKESDNRKRMILILTDGEESKPKILNTLVADGMCNTIRNEFNELYIGVLGIGYNPNNTGYSNCVIDPKNDIKYVKNLSLLLDEINELIKKGAQTDGTAKLHYRFTD
ncbi:VWA domain-containing protein [Photobacterium sp. SDRW27]|uniref:VWA domain-containing protein n=1 Tax=Photobacterium obscurum TaxID=2829490 RepID=UPI002243859A|nr:VWA domain-containing protein [Photobacterium obscurum]MCW8327425.1 VWA domain-containing protein [Photobacterium obscurum]